MNSYFPMFIDMKDREVIVFGAGETALRRVGVLLEFGAQVRVIAPEFRKEFQEFSQLGHSLFLEPRRYRPSELREPAFVLAATGDGEVDAMIFRECRHKDILVNVASNQEQCDFFFPGIAREGEVTVGVTANGKDHRKAAEVTEQIRTLLKGTEQ